LAKIFDIKVTVKHASFFSLICVSSFLFQSEHPIVKTIEKTVFRQEKSVNATTMYRKRIRTISMKIGNNDELKGKVLSGEIDGGTLLELLDSSSSVS